MGNIAIQFFNDVVKGWMIGDLDRMETSIPPIPNANGNCNFPICLYIFACIEFLGYLSSPVEYPDGSKDFTKNRILSYIDQFFGENYIQQINQNRDIFVTNFRHGLAHQYFAKAAGISRNSGTLVTKDLGSGMLVLDADEFYVAFKASTSKLETVITNNSNGISERITERYIKLVEGDKQKYKNRFNFPETDTPVNTTISGMASLASLPNQQMSEQLKKAHQKLIDNPLMTSSELDLDDL